MFIEFIESYQMVPFQEIFDCIIVAAEDDESKYILCTSTLEDLGAFDPAVVTSGTIRSGATINIFCENAEITGTVRTLSAAVQEKIIHEIEHIAQGTARLYDAEATLSYMYGYPAVINHEASVLRIEAAIQGLVQIVHPNPAMGGEDFAYYLQQRPGAFFFLGCRPDQGEVYPHHSPHFLMNEKALPLGVEVLVHSVRAFLEE
jgi:amidohydrolase